VLGTDRLTIEYGSKVIDILLQLGHLSVDLY